MKTILKTILASALCSLMLISCGGLKPQDVAHGVKETYYHYWHDQRKHERGIKFNVQMKGERLNMIDLGTLEVNGHSLALESELIEPLDRDALSTLNIWAIYKEKKGKKDTDFTPPANTLFGQEPFPNAVMNYSVQGKSQQLNIKSFDYKPKG
ncbi:MAG: hypothetical protein ACPGEC_00800 [Flavobacteriales bacterium]